MDKFLENEMEKIRELFLTHPDVMACDKAHRRLMKLYMRMAEYQLMLKIWNETAGDKTIGSENDE